MLHFNIYEKVTDFHNTGMYNLPTLADRGCRVVSATDPYGR
jgi:hypothetical protein